MAFNFGAETPPSPPLFKVEENGYVVGQESGHSGVRVRIKSLKNAKKEPLPEEIQTEKNEPSLKGAAPVKETPPAKETSPLRVIPLAKAVELTLFDLPPIELPQETTASTADIMAAGWEEAGSVQESNAPVLESPRVSDAVYPIVTADPIAELEEHTPDTAGRSSNSIEDPLPDKIAKPIPLTRKEPVIENTSTPQPKTGSEPIPETTAAPLTETIESIAGPIPEADPIQEADPILKVAPILQTDSIPEAKSIPKVAPIPATHSPAKKTPPGKPAKSKRGRKSLKQATAEADLIEVPGDDVLFSKQYYTMRAVAEMFKVNQSLLRFWETEFDILQPRKNKKGDRYFRPVDIKNLHLIYHLLRQRKYTIEGAKEFLKGNKKAEERFEAIQRLQQLKAFLLEWKAQL